MGLTGCYALLKYLVVIVNLIFWLAGLAVIIVAVWMLTDPTFYLSMAQDESSYYTGIYIFLVTGALMFIVGFLGCCGAYKESPCMLVTFFFFLLIIMVAEIAAGVWAYSNSNRLHEIVTESVKSTVQQEYGVVETRTNTFDAIQRGLQCCGASGPKDWAMSEYNKAGKNDIVLAVSSITQTYKIPPSCCREDMSEDLCENARKVALAAKVSGAIYEEGCIDKLIDTLKSHMSIVLGVGIGIGAIEILGLIFSLILCCAIRGNDRYKA